MKRAKMEREETLGDDDKHSPADVPRAVCVTHKSLNCKKHNSAAKPSQKSSAKAFSLVDSGPSTKTFSHAQKHANKRPPFQTLETIPTTAFTHFSWWRVLSSVIKEEEKTQTEIEIKRKSGEMREKKKVRKAKEMNKKDEGEKWTKRKAMIEKRKNVERKKSEIEKGRNKNKKWRLFGRSFVV